MNVTFVSIISLEKDIGMCIIILVWFYYILICFTFVYILFLGWGFEGHNTEVSCYNPM